MNTIPLNVFDLNEALQRHEVMKGLALQKAMVKRIA